MSENHEPDRELEALLRKLEPSQLGRDRIETLHRAGRIAVAECAHDPTRIHWRRVVPLTLAGCLAMFAYAAYHAAPVMNGTVDMAATETSSPAVATPVPVSSATDRFIPISSQGYVLNASSGGVVQTDEGPRERVTVEFEDAYHWHDPATGTNIRFFQPRNEEFSVPLRTD